LKRLFFSDILNAENKKAVSIVAEKKEKQYVSDNAQLIAEWDWEKNQILGYFPNEISYGSAIKV
jgi:hypothetical protein